MYDRILTPFEKGKIAIIRDKEHSLYNKTHICRREMNKATQYIMKKYNLTYKDSLTKLINYAFDKKLKLEYVKNDKTKIYGVETRIVNLHEL